MDNVCNRCLFSIPSKVEMAEEQEYLRCPFFLSFSYPSNIEIIFDFSDIITKIHPPFQNPGSALAEGHRVSSGSL